MHAKERPRSDPAPELFAIPLDIGQYLVYAPQAPFAFVGNAAAVNVLADSQIGLEPDGRLGRELCHRIALHKRNTRETRASSRLADPTLVQVEDLEGRLETIDEQTFAEEVGASIAEGIAALERERRSYSIRISLPIQYPQAFSAVIVRLCSAYRPESVVIDPLADGSAPMDATPAEVDNLVQALRRVRTLCADVRCEIAVPGARLENPSCLCGDCRKAGHNGDAYCSGCFAKHHCLGTCEPDRGAKLRVAGSVYCHLVRLITKDELLARIACADGLVWRGELRVG